MTKKKLRRKAGCPKKYEGKMVHKTYRAPESAIPAITALIAREKAKFLTVKE